MAKSDVLVRMKADVSNYDANIANARKTLDGFKQDNLTLGGIMNQSTKSIVAAAAQYASFAAVIGTVASGFADAASRGMEMSKEAEGVSKAFERLNQPGLLDNLREATHGTVNDLELMKQAVKFDNFNLSLEQMGTFLAFAQQQAKDTGQDVNYLVDSIVTGLGRKSLPILDNLGLSAEEIKKRMAETGDMTTAVAQIIEERMKDAGDYVETAADRAAQAQARLDNAMKELGDTMNSLTGAGATLWTDLKIGAIDLANSAIKPLIEMFNSLAEYINGPTVEGIVTRGMTDVTDTVDDNGRLIRKNAIASIPEITVSGTASKKKRTGGVSRSSTPSFDDFDKALGKSLNGSVDLKETADALSPYQMMLPEIKKNILDIKDADLGGALAKLGDDKVKKEIEDMTKSLNSERMAFGLAGQAASAFGSALSSIDDPGAKAAGTVMQAIASIALGFATASAQANTAGTGWGWLAWIAAGMSAMATTIATVHSLTGYAQGGMIKGNTYSGDNIGGLVDGNQLVGLNAGEVVLNAAQQNTLAQNLQGNAPIVRVVGKISGTDIILSADRTLMTQGKQLAVWGM